MDRHDQKLRRELVKIAKQHPSAAPQIKKALRRHKKAHRADDLMRKLVDPRAIVKMRRQVEPDTFKTLRAITAELESRLFGDRDTVIAIRKLNRLIEQKDRLDSAAIANQVGKIAYLLGVNTMVGF